jgi:hypothetical protein
VLPAAEQIARARDAVMELERKELDELMADLISLTVAAFEPGDQANACSICPSFS